MKKLFLFFCVNALFHSAYATPQKIEMIFLSPQKVSMLLEQLDKLEKKSSPKFSTKYSQADMENCVPMGDGCFHPQMGFVEKSQMPSTGTTAPVATAPEVEPNVEVKTFNSTETSLVNCDKNNYFDIFCGKEKPRARYADVEVWFDISSSLKSVDYSKDADFCQRRTFISKVMDQCKEKIKVSIYNTSIKEAGELSSVCMNYGTNDEAKLLQWIKGSEAKTLLIVTDIDELSPALRSFLDEKGAKFIGDGVKPFTASDLADYAKDFSKSCH
jgi:hypothetical protein